MSGFGISKTGAGTPTSDQLVYFNKLTPTTAGVVFSPNTPAISGLLYISSVDASVWIWDGIEYISYSNDAVVLAVTYSEFNTLITASELDIDKKYLITDYQTIYDQPDFSALNTPKAVVSTLTGTVEPLIVTPVAVNKISNVALSTVYPNDAILYDWTFVATEVMGVSAKGRITQRTDTSKNTVSYDSRNVLYKRYDNGSGEYTIYWDNGNASNSAIPTFANLNTNYNINFIVTDPTLANTNDTFLLPNTLFYGDSYDIKAGNSFYNNTFTNLTKSSFKDNCNDNILSGGSSNNIENNFSTNTINIGFSNNNIGDEFQNNTVGVDFQFNTIGYDFYQNTIGDTFQYNSVANEFLNNTIANDVNLNTFGDYCYSNNLASSFEKNTIGGTFQNNTTTSLFQKNTIENGANLNTFATALNNNIGVGFVGNTLGNNFNNNFIGNGFGNNNVGTGFLSNKFGNFCIYNTIGFDFVKNNIGDTFQNNTVGDTINDLFIQNNYTSQTISSGTNTQTDIEGLNTGFVKNTNGVLQDIPFGAASQYVRGDGTLASFPDIAGGGGGQVYYCNGGTSEGTIGGNAFYQLSTGAVIGTGVDFTSGTVDDVVFANFITDIGKPTQEIVPAGVWIFQCYFSASASNTEVYAKIEVYDGSTFTVLSTSLIEAITGNSTIDLYTFTCAVPEYAPLTTTDRIAIRFYPKNLAGSHTITLHTQDSHLSSIQTTFTTGIASLDGLTAAAQYFQTGTSGTDFNITTSGSDTHVFNLPTASATNRGLLSTSDWTTFNGKVGGNGTTNYLPKFSTSSTVTNSQIFDNGTNVGIGTVTPAKLLDVNGDILVNGLTIGRGNNNIATNTVVGSGAGNSITTGANNTFIGIYSGYLNTTGNNNVFIGKSSGSNNSIGNSNTFIGNNSGENNTNGSSNLISGFYAGRYIADGITPLTIVNESVFLGANTKALADNQTNQIVVGYNVIGKGSNTVNIGNTFMTDTLSNTFAGKNSGNANTTGLNNTFLGCNSGLNNTTASTNTFVGTSSGYTNTTGANNSFLGNGSGLNNTTGTDNVFIGKSSGQLNTTGSSNTFLGLNSGYGNTIGSSNLFLGTAAGRFIQDGTTDLTNATYSVFLGQSTKALADNQTNQIVIGHNTTGKGSNTVNIGNTYITNTYLNGAVTVNNAFTLPTTDGTANQVLKTNGSGVVTWGTAGSSSGIWGIANSSGVYTYYATWALAVAAAVSGQVIELFADITESSVSYTLKNGVNVNGNGHTITATMIGATACLSDGGIAVTCDVSNITINKTVGTGVSITNTSSIITGNCILKGVDLSSDSLILYGQLSGWTITGASRYPVDIFSTAILTNVYISTTETSAVAITTNASTIKINNCVIKSSGAGISGASGGGIINNCTVNANSGGISCISGEVNNCSIITNTLIALTLGAGSTANNCYARSASGIATSGTSTSYFNECTIVSDANVLGSSTPSFTNCKMWSKADWVLNGGGGGKVINCHLISGYNNVSGWVINEPTSNTYVIDCILEVANSGTTAIRSTTTPTLYLKGNSVKGTTNFKSAGIVNGQTNTADAQGNVILN